MNQLTTPNAPTQLLVSGAEIKAAMIAANISYVPHHACYICGTVTFYSRVEEQLFYHSACSCSWSPKQLRSWESAADWINVQKDASIRNGLRTFFGLPYELDQSAEDKIPVLTDEVKEAELQNSKEGKAHKHAAIICAWVNGQQIQGQSPSTDQWVDVPSVNDLGKDDNFLDVHPLHPDFDWWPNWRIKP